MYLLIRRSLLTLLIFCFCFEINCQSTYEESIFSKKDLLLDFDILSDCILKNHPGAFLYKTKTEWLAFLKAKRSAINDEMSETDFLKFAATITNEIKCGHTSPNYSLSFIKKNIKRKHKFLPFSVWFENDKIKITKFAKKDSVNLSYNAEITAVNGIPADSIYKVICTAIAPDGYSNTYQKAFSNLTFKPYFRRYFGERDSFLITYKDTKQLIHSKYVKASREFFPQPNFEDYFFKRKNKIVFSASGNDFLMLDTFGLNIPVLKLRSFSNNYAAFYKSIFKYIDYFKLKILVIDLRNNLGGSLFHVEALLSYLLDKKSEIIYSKANQSLSHKSAYSQKFVRFFSPYFFKKKFIKEIDSNYIYYEHKIFQKQAHHFDGKIFVLINGASFSASCITAAYLKDKTDALILGEETGGTASGCNAVQIPKLVLPNTKIRVTMPLYRVNHILSEVNYGEGIKPNIEFKYKTVNIINKQDLEWEKILKLLAPNQ